MGSGFSKMKKQARQLEQQMGKMQEEMENKEFIGEAGGLVKVILNGSMKVKKITINPECVDPEDVDALQDLLVSAFEEAHAKAKSDNPMNKMGLPF
ncbi:MAG: YbaB/EbfC family nucleoid-associated protein [Simkaniaceae bacterium]|nr:YbaB/EbfC family nucleoid-associated protein [Simkaniaceae bacterium]